VIGWKALPNKDCLSRKQVAKPMFRTESTKQWFTCRLSYKNTYLRSFSKNQRKSFKHNSKQLAVVSQSYRQMSNKLLIKAMLCALNISMFLQCPQTIQNSSASPMFLLTVFIDVQSLKNNKQNSINHRETDHSIY